MEASRADCELIPDAHFFCGPIEAPERDEGQMQGGPSGPKVGETCFAP